VVPHLLLNVQATIKNPTVQEYWDLILHKVGL